MQTRLLLQVLADHIPGVRQELDLDIAGAKLPQEAWRSETQGRSRSAKHDPDTGRQETSREERKEKTLNGSFGKTSVYET